MGTDFSDFWGFFLLPDFLFWYLFEFCFSVLRSEMNNLPHFLRSGKECLLHPGPGWAADETSFGNCYAKEETNCSQSSLKKQFLMVSLLIHAIIESAAQSLGLLFFPGSNWSSKDIL